MPRRPPPKPIARATAQRAPDRHIAALDCEADILEGLEPFGSDELSERFGRYVEQSARPAAGKLGFPHPSDLRALLGLRRILPGYLSRPYIIPPPKAPLGPHHPPAPLHQI